MHRYICLKQLNNCVFFVCVRRTLFTWCMSHFENSQFIIPCIDNEHRHWAWLVLTYASNRNHSFKWSWQHFTLDTIKSELNRLFARMKRIFFKPEKWVFFRKRKQFHDKPTVWRANNSDFMCETAQWINKRLSFEICVKWSWIVLSRP